MKLIGFLQAELDREVERSRHALEEVPEGKYDWKPHDKSMIFGYLADMVATIPLWIAMEVTKKNWTWLRQTARRWNRSRRRPARR